MSFIIILLLVAAWNFYGSSQRDETSAGDKWESCINEAGGNGKPRASAAGTVGSRKC